MYASCKCTRAHGQVTKARIVVVQRALLETLPTVPDWLATSDWVELQITAPE